MRKLLSHLFQRGPHSLSLLLVSCLLMSSMPTGGAASAASSVESELADSSFLGMLPMKFLPVPDASPTQPAFSISPSSGAQGKEYEVIVSGNDCVANPLMTFELYAPIGSGIVVNSKQGDCQLTAKLTIAPDAPLGPVKLWLTKDAGPNTPTVEFTVTGVTPQPIPPGLNNKGTVDVMWSVLPDAVTNDNFGGKVSREFYCIEAVIGNDSGYDLQLSSIGFTLPGLSAGKYRIPSSGYRTVRGSLEAFQTLAPRQFVVNGFKMLGPLLTGFLPFFHAVNHKSNFSQAINVISNPLEKGLESIWPDLVPTELDRLADMTFRDDVSTKTIIPNNVQARILTFVPRRLVCPDKKSCPAANSTTTLSAKNPQHVMQALGEIVIVGQEIAHVNRVRVVNTPFGASVTDHSVSGRITDLCNLGVANALVTLEGSGGFTAREMRTAADGTFTFANVADGRTYTVTPKLADMKFAPAASAPFLLNDTKAGVDYRAEYVVIKITGKVTNKSDGTALANATITVTGTGLSAAKTGTTNDKGEYEVSVPADGLNPLTTTFTITPTLTGKTFEPANATWTCTQRTADFKAKPSPSPAQ